MKVLDTLLARISFALLGLVIIASPWLFGAWEMWWFWLFAVGLFAAAALLGVRLMLTLHPAIDSLPLQRPILPPLLAFLPFLIYALVRFLQTEVFMDAERGFLLFLTPCLAALVIALGFSRRQCRVLVWLLVIDFFLLAAYGIANHWLYHNARVLWMPGFTQYQEGYFRATGSYYCPDHFAGVMELALCLALGLLLARGTRPALRIAALPLAAAALTAIVLSKSRGGGLTVGVLLVAVLWFGVWQYPTRMRWILRLSFLALLLAGILVLLYGPWVFAARFRDYPWKKPREANRVIMAAAALRAWQHQPVFGIGVNMHRNYWLHVAASPDGDRATGRWPSQLNNSFHSYEVHSDWVQLLEELGVVGLALFLVALGVLLAILFRNWRRIARRQAPAPPETAGPAGLDTGWSVLAALLALLAMTFHSIGDFNLQMPATTWLLAALIALPFAVSDQAPGDS